ncbi:MAG: TadE/TadG family type IV pilus assembly protein [Parerythrobacter sp.]
MPEQLIRRRQSLGTDESGLALIEFAFMAPIFLFFGLAGLEFTQVMLAHQKTERVAATVADQVASNIVPPNERQIGDLFQGAELIARPYDLANGGSVIITAVIGIIDNDTGELQNKVAWQRCQTPDGNPSAIGTQWTGSTDIADGPDVGLPQDIELAQNHMVIVSEVFLQYDPMINLDYLPTLAANGGLFTETSVFRTRGSPIMNVTPFPGVPEHTC